MIKSLKIIIAGGRDYSDYQIVKEELNQILEKYRYCQLPTVKTVGL